MRRWKYHILGCGSFWTAFIGARINGFRWVGHLTRVRFCFLLFYLISAKCSWEKPGTRKMFGLLLIWLFRCREQKPNMEAAKNVRSAAHFVWSFNSPWSFNFSKHWLSPFSADLYSEIIFQALHDMPLETSGLMRNGLKPCSVCNIFHWTEAELLGVNLL